MSTQGAIFQTQIVRKSWPQFDRVQLSSFNLWVWT